MIFIFIFKFAIITISISYNYDREFLSLSFLSPVIFFYPLFAWRFHFVIQEFWALNRNSGKGKFIFGDQSCCGKLINHRCPPFGCIYYMMLYSYRNIPVFPSLNISLSLPLLLPLPISPTLLLFFYFSLSLSASLPLSLSNSPCHSLPPSLCFSLSFSLTLSLSLSVFLSIFVYVCLSLRYERPILLSREPYASKDEISEATRLQKELSTIVNEFILKRGNTLNAQHLPPKLVSHFPLICTLLFFFENLLLTSLEN